VTLSQLESAVYFVLCDFVGVGVSNILSAGVVHETSSVCTDELPIIVA
jgi:hypothetical protein